MTPNIVILPEEDKSGIIEYKDSVKRFTVRNPKAPRANNNYEGILNTMLSVI